MPPNIVNPYRYAATGFDDTDLKAYWKFDEAAGDILNSSEASASLTSDAALQVTGDGYQEGSPLASGGNSMSFNGVDQDAVSGTSLTQFKYLHNGSLWTNAWWSKDGRDGGKFFGTITSNQEGLKLRIEATGSVEFAIYNGSAVGLISGSNSSDNFVPDTTNWYFYVFSWDYSLGSLNFKIRRDNGNQETKNKTGTVPSDGDSGYPFTFAKNPAADDTYSNFYVSEYSTWNKIMSDDDQTDLWNGGDGLEIY